MAQVELIMPKMGESIMEATILKWVKQVGDTVEEDETILEIATDKVDSEVPSPVSGTIKEIRFPEDETVEIGKVIAIIETEGEGVAPQPSPSVKEEAPAEEMAEEVASPQPEPTPAAAEAAPAARTGSGNRFYSPLVRTIADKEQISLQELDQIEGSGQQGRVTKKDILAYVEQRKSQGSSPATAPAAPRKEAPSAPQPPRQPAAAPAVHSSDDNVEIIEMDRMRRLIADHMVNSKQTSPHVTSFVEVDVTDIVNWRNRVKKAFQEKHGEKITFTPIFMEAVAKAICDFPMINASVDGSQIIRKKQVNLGMAAALPSGNLIVPVIKNADQLNLLGLTKQVNSLAARARANQLKPEEIQGGTFTLTNVGTFGNVMGTPIINQPQVAILAVGAIRKKPAVVETEYGDLIAVRHMMFLSLSYDHRVVDGFLGGSFLRRVGDYLEAFDADQRI
ncbi:dihydrolipoamide acetyltransferase family protein [Phaeodactylibacter luteus]|uniref:Dihydrolipoamide acetyltransferase component of pyruvate dehydrogenase complex n=1 Tax=Phaeodactylibacter luteus TaxID=1564516 RepID=A0A5C6RWM6_9BACT|nr:dihydrolipoamide acetyltransferase family protein [Phaeodactylibacter luteus]TXB66259.1 2-oxo acid dehydrogenase subunit E2 [Phaeodactylibacter luteus]